MQIVKQHPDSKHLNDCLRGFLHSDKKNIQSSNMVMRSIQHPEISERTLCEVSGKIMSDITWRELDEPSVILRYTPSKKTLKYASYGSLIGSIWCGEKISAHEHFCAVSTFFGYHISKMLICHISQLSPSISICHIYYKSICY